MHVSGSWHTAVSGAVSIRTLSLQRIWCLLQLLGGCSVTAGSVGPCWHHVLRHQLSLAAAMDPSHLAHHVLCCACLPPSLPCPCRLVDEGFNPSYGARPLRRAIMRLIEDCLAERILSGDIKEGDVVIMDVDPDGAIAVLAGDKKMRAVMDATPAGIS